MWMNWVNKGSVLPPPYNLIPNPKAVIHLFRKIRDKCRGFKQVGGSLYSRLNKKRKLTRKKGGWPLAISERNLVRQSPYYAREI